MKKCIFLLFPIFVYSQDLPIGNWKDFLSYTSAKEIVEIEDEIYCITRSGLFTINKNDFFISRKSKVNGLSDIGLNNIAYDSFSKTIILSYDNCNIDLIRNGVVVNISDIKRESITGKKQINDVIASNGTAYISTSFGLIILDLVNEEIKDTYKIIKNDILLDIANCSVDSSNGYHEIYIATSAGLYKGISDVILNDPNNWFLQNNITMSASSVIKNKDVGLTLYKDSGSSYLHIFYPNNNSLTEDRGLSKVYYNNGFLTKIYKDTVCMASFSNNIIDTFTSNRFVKINDIIIGNEGYIWIADSLNNILLFENYQYLETISPNGPITNSVYSIDYRNDKLYVSHGGHSNFSSNSLNMFGASIKNNYDEWENYNFYALGNARDVVASASIEDKDFFASWYDGIVVLKNGEFFIKYGYENTNGVLDTTYYSNNRIQISDLKFDLNGNLWGLNSQVNKPLFVKTVNNEWYSFSMNQDIVGLYFDELLIDNQNKKWGIIARNKGLFVYDDKGTIDYLEDDEYKILNTGIGNGNLHSMQVYCLEKDLDGEVWVGTNEGVCVFYSPELIFSNYNFDAQRILIQEGDYGQYLLSEESVKCIKIDGANRKWIGTESAGLFLLSEDGTEEIRHFTKENSPLLSDNILDIAINHRNGEVFIATELGILSYRSDATIGSINKNRVSVFPNPIKNGYNGLIAINGLSQNSIVKITDINGNLVHEGMAKGSQLTWRGDDKDGNRVSSGVYLVFNYDDDGKDKVVAKILFIHQ